MLIFTVMHANVSDKVVAGRLSMIYSLDNRNLLVRQHIALSNTKKNTRRKLVDINHQCSVGGTHASDHRRKYRVYQQALCDDASRERQPICRDIKEHDTYLMYNSVSGQQLALREEALAIGGRAGDKSSITHY